MILPLAPEEAAWAEREPGIECDGVRLVEKHPMSIANPDVLLSLADWARIESEAGVEFDGERLVEKPAMSVDATLAAANILGGLRSEAKRTEKGVVLGAELSYQCFPGSPAKQRKPDVTYFDRARLPADVRALRVMTVAPDLAVEVVSPNDRAYHVDEKVREYLDAGVRCVWIVNPPQRSVRVHYADRTSRTFYADDEITGEPFLPSFRSKVAAFFEL